MNLSKFVDYNKTCPLCKNPLNLYMQWLDSFAFKGSEKEDIYRFNILKADRPSDDYIELSKDGKLMPSPKLNILNFYQELRKTVLYFYLVCNAEGVRRSYDSYSVNMYKACYHRSSPMVELSVQNDELCLQVVNKDFIETINCNEAFTIKYLTSHNIEKIYMVDLNYEQKETTLYYYSVNETQKDDKSFNPNVLDKKLPLLNKMPDLSVEARPKLVNKLESWIIMS